MVTSAPNRISPVRLIFPLVAVAVVPYDCVLILPYTLICPPVTETVLVPLTVFSVKVGKDTVPDDPLAKLVLLSIAKL